MPYIAERRRLTFLGVATKEKGYACLICGRFHRLLRDAEICEQKHQENLGSRKPELQWKAQAMGGN